MREIMDLTEGTRGKKMPPDPYPNDKSHSLKNGRSLETGEDLNPKGEQWKPKGKPRFVQISKLDLHPAGLSIAKSAWTWDRSFRHGNTKPVVATLHDGMLHVLDGYHRVVQAAKDGEDAVLVQIVR